MQEDERVHREKEEQEVQAKAQAEAAKREEVTHAENLRQEQLAAAAKLREEEADDKAVPDNKKSEKSKKKRPRVVNSSDLDGSSTDEDEEGDGDGENLSEAELRKRERLGHEIIDDFLRNPGTAKMCAWFRKAVKDHQWFMPRAATTSRELALEVLKTTQGNQFCIWHHAHDKGGKKHDSAKGPYKVTGTPYPRLSDKTLKKMALLDLYLWKTWTARNGSGESEGLHNQRIDPCTRLFIAEAYKTHAGLVVDDLYTNGKDELEAKKLRLHTQIVRLSSEYDAIAGFHNRKGLIISLPGDSDHEDDDEEDGIAMSN
ncbi:hypothetical protein PILCRDRAFT_17018 [Piloderma croceum F 1598]|uniref:Uncharacterized protein n=1 Tax=Piloderma croceum (strain F 1598) TaxID=765440 RepID=A0A0C3B2M6_PILCF|nr:hypothetical protein PILCRDRAFT_17018 [Piloderma croceum F 1598]